MPAIRVVVAGQAGRLPYKRCGAGNGAVEGEDFADAVLFERKLVGHMTGFECIAPNDNFAVAEQMVIDHLRVTTEMMTR